MKGAIDGTVEYVKSLARRMCGCDPNDVVLVMLMEMGIPVNHVGFEYLKTAVLLQYEDPMRSLSNDIYPALLKRYANSVGSSKQLDGALRGVVRTGWERTGMETWIKYFPTIRYQLSGPPTNSEVIAGLARIVELWKGCSDAYLRQCDREVTGCGWK